MLDLDLHRTFITKILSCSFLVIQFFLIVSITYSLMHSFQFFDLSTCKKEPFLFLLELFLSLLFSVLFHELGHFFTGILAGYDRFKLILEPSVNFIRIQATSRIYPKKLARVYFYAGGIIANADLIVMSIILYQTLSYSTSSIFFALFLSNILLFVVNSLPLTVCGYDVHRIIEVLKDSTK